MGLNKYSDAERAAHMVAAAIKAAQQVGTATYEEFEDHPMMADAVIRNLEIIGEAANGISDEFKENYHALNWFQIRGLRNRLAHDYVDTSLEVIYDIVKHDIPKLLQVLGEYGV